MTTIYAILKSTCLVELPKLNLLLSSQSIITTMNTKPKPNGEGRLERPLNKPVLWLTRGKLMSALSKLVDDTFKHFDYCEIVSITESQ